MFPIAKTRDAPRARAPAHGDPLRGRLGPAAGAAGRRRGARGDALRRALRAGARARDAGVRRLQPPQLRRPRAHPAPERGARRRDDALRDHGRPASPRRGPVPRPVLGAMLVGFLGVGAVITRATRRACSTAASGAARRSSSSARRAGSSTRSAPRVPELVALRFTALTAAAGTLSILVVTAVAALAGWTRLPSGGRRRRRGPGDRLRDRHRRARGRPGLERGRAGDRRAERGALQDLVPTTAFVIALAGGYGAGAWELGRRARRRGRLVGANVLSRRAAPRAARLRAPGSARAGEYRHAACPSSAWTAPSARPPTSRRPSTRSRRASPRASASRRSWAPRAPARR